MKAKYRHTQYGTFMFLVFLLTGILIAVAALRILSEDRVPSAILILGVYLFGFLMFYSFTIEILEEKLKFWFGLGIIQKTIALSEIHSTKEIKNPWYYFWGVKAIPGGWFYAIAPGTAVEIEFRDGKIIQLGTNQPKKLSQAIETARRQVSKICSSKQAIVGLFLWKKWGFWLYCALQILSFIVNLSNGVGIGRALYGLLSIPILYGVLLIGKNNKGWPQLE